MLQNNFREFFLNCLERGLFHLVNFNYFLVRLYLTIKIKNYNRVNWQL